MVIKGNARGSPADLAKHLQRRDTNERVEILGLRGVASLDLAGALREMDAFGAALRTDRTLYHASINVRADEVLTPAQRTAAIDRLESALGLTGQPRAIVEHEKHGRVGEGRIHWHVVWSRTDMEHMRAIRCDHNFRTHELVAREMEREFGHARVQGVHIERNGPDGKRIERPDRTPSHAELQQAARTGIDPHQMKAEITALWRSTDSGKSFAAALEQQGYVLARGDRRDFVIVDRHGEVHSLARRIDGATAKDVRVRMADLDRNQVPDVAQARATQQARQLARRERQAEPARTPTPAREQGRQETRAAAEKVPQPSSTPATSAMLGKLLGRANGKRDVRSPADPAASMVGGALKGLGGLASFAEGLFSPPKPPTPDQAKHAVASAEQDRQAAFRAHVQEIAQRQSSITDEARGKQRVREQDMRDQAARDYRKREEDGRTR
jgi:hypothetical protein